jgi:rubrerythrin
VSTLDNFKDSFKKEGVVLPSLHRHVMRQAAEEDNERSTDKMHPSAMAKAGWCPRQDYYTITLGDRAKESISFVRENIFDEGHTIHRKYQRWFHEMGILYGWWDCLCGHYWEDHSPTNCPACGSISVRYREIPLANSQYLIEGHADGGIVDTKGLFDIPAPLLLEMKSIGIGTLRMDAPHLHQLYLDGSSLEELWREVKRPFPSHVRQATLYCWLSQFGPQPFNHMLFIYECKWNQQTKEFLVEVNQGHIEWILEAALDVARCVKQGIEPYRPPWASQDIKTCKTCPFRAECWGEQHVKAHTSTPTVKRASAAARRKVLRPATKR